MTLNLLDTVFGALLSGVIVNSWIFGLICVLSSQYYRNFPKDSNGTKLLVLWMLVLQGFNAALVSKMIYFYLIDSFGNKAALGVATWEFALFHGLSAVAAFFVQIYNARRIFVMTKHYFSLAVLILLATVSVGFALTAMTKIFIIKIIDDLGPVSWIVIVWLTLSAACDFLITGFQVMYLNRHRTGIKRTNRMIDVLILYVMSTGLLTSFTVVAELTTFAILGWNYVHVFISVPLGGVYVVSFLVNLDARRRVRDIDPSGPHTFQMFRENSEVQELSISIKHTQEVHTDSRLDRENGIGGGMINLENKSSTFGSSINVDAGESAVVFP